MKKYYVNYYLNFANTYNIISVESENDKKIFSTLEGYERISLKKAKKLITREKEQRKNNPAFSHYAPIKIKSASEMTWY